MSKLCLFILICFIALKGYCYLPKYSYQAQKDSGIWSDIIIPQPQLGSNPTQHFLCAFSIRQMKWTQLMYNCNCANQYLAGNVVFKCQWCNNSFWTMVNSFKAVYCHINNWNNQIIKTFDTRNTDGRNWYNYKCPQETYVSKVAPKFGKQLDRDIGFVGMQLRCSNLDFTQNYKIQDKNKQSLSQFSQNSIGTFVSGHQLKYQQNGKFTGIKLYFQGAPFISSIETTYKQITSSKGVQKIIQTIYLSNQLKQTSQINAIFKNVYTIGKTWKNVDSYIGGYKIGDGVFLKSPQINTNNNNYLNQYTQSKDKALFDKQIFTYYNPKSSIILIIPSLTNISIVSKLQQIKSIVAYESKIKISDQYTGQLITDKFIIGNWSGIIATPITLSFQQTQCVGGYNNVTNLIINGDFQQNKCTLTWCNFNLQNYASNIDGWIPNPDLQIGKGTLYNSKMGNSWVAQLDTQNNSCLKQKIDLQIGKYSLSFDWSAITRLPLKSSMFQVKINSEIKLNGDPKDYNLHRQNIQFELSTYAGESYIQFCATGTSDGGGATIDNIKLIKWSDSLTTKLNKY